MKTNAKKTPTKTGPGIGALEAARDAVSTATAKTTAAPAADSAGWQTVADAREAEGWLPTEAFDEGRTVQGRIIDALLVADDERGGYRVAYKLELTTALDFKDGSGFDVGAVVLMGERHKLKALRSVKLGAEVRVTAGATVKLKGGRTMHLFSVQSRGGAGAVVADHLTAAFKTMGNGEVWNGSTDAGGEDVPF